MKSFSIKSKSEGPVRKNAFDDVQSASKYFGGDEDYGSEEGGDHGIRRAVSELGSSESKESRQQLVIPAQPNDLTFKSRSKELFKPIKQEPVSGQSSQSALSYGLNVLFSDGNKIKQEDSREVKVEQEDYTAPHSGEPKRPVSFEEKAFVQDISTRPDAPALDAYKRVPVEEFGAALLRGMGWKGDSSNKDKETEKEREDASSGLVQKRPAFLGLGAKSRDSASVNEAGSWGKGASRRPERSYVPLAKKDRQTGEIIREEDSKRSRSRSPPRDRGGRRYPEERHDSRYGGHRSRNERYRSSGSSYSRSDRDRDRDRNRDRDRPRYYR